MKTFNYNEALTTTVIDYLGLVEDEKFLKLLDAHVKGTVKADTWVPTNAIADLISHSDCKDVKRVGIVGQGDTRQTWGPNRLAHIIDGKVNSNGTWTNGSYFWHSVNGNKPWFQIEMEKACHVNGVLYVGRDNTSQNSNVNVYVGNKAAPNGPTSGKANGTAKSINGAEYGDVCSTGKHGHWVIGKASGTDMRCKKPILGKYVTAQGASSNVWWVLQELRIY